MDKRIGYVHNYDFSMRDGRCKLVVFIDESYREFGIGAIAAISFMRKLFDDYPIRRMYLDIYDYNKESLVSNLKAGFKEEGVIKNYRYHDGSFYDLHILSMDRKTFETKLGGRI
jgi:RimJ/RimL family protein N-acetyltransferase